MTDPIDHLEKEIDRLYSQPLSSFTSSRNQLAAALRRRKRREEANRVKALPKPSLPAWCANQLYWKRTPLWKGLVTAGQRLRDAASDPSRHKQLTQERRDALARLEQEAEKILAEAGHALAANTLKQVHDTLEAVSLYGDQLPEEPPGRLSRPLQPPGFEVLLGLSSSPPPSRSRARASASKISPKVSAAALRKARAELARAEREAARRRRELGQSESTLEQLKQRCQRLEREVGDLKQRLKRRQESWQAELSALDAALEEVDAVRKALAEAESTRVAALEIVEKSRK